MVSGAYDEEIGLSYLQSRYYSPEWGRFINLDGLMGEQGDLLSHNLFAYCKNNPINMEDSTGFRPIESADFGRETYESINISLQYMQNPTQKKPYKPRYPKSSGSGLKSKIKKYAKSFFKNTITESIGYKMSKSSWFAPVKFDDIPSVQKWIFGKAPLNQVVKKWETKLGYVGVVTTAWDVGVNLYKGDYVEAGFDLGKFGDGLLAGAGIALLGLSGGGAIAAGVVAAGIIDFGAETIKNIWFKKE